MERNCFTGQSPASSSSFVAGDRPFRNLRSRRAREVTMPVSALHPRTAGSLVRCSAQKPIPRSVTASFARTARQDVERRHRHSCLLSAVSRRHVLLHAIAAESFPASTLLSFPSLSESEPLGQIGRHPEDPPTFVKATGRIIAIGDIHGDLQKAIASLTAAGVLKESYGQMVWCGGDTTVVQLGDVLDRGEGEIAAVMMLRQLDRQAREEGGRVYMLNGNHESFNVAGNFRYVTPGGFRETARAIGMPDWQINDSQLLLRARLAMFSPGGPMARELASNPTVLVVNNVVFAHGGLLPLHVNYGLERLNAEVSAWMRGDRLEDGSRPRPPFFAMGNPSAVMCNRMFGTEKFKSAYDRTQACMMLRQTLDMLSAKQLVVGHTPQLNGANCECEGMVWRADVGMSSGVYNAVPQVLEMTQGPDGELETRVLTAPKPSILPAPLLPRLASWLPL